MMGLWDRIDRAMQSAFAYDGPQPQAPDPVPGTSVDELRLFAPSFLRRKARLRSRRLVEGRVVESRTAWGWYTAQGSTVVENVLFTVELARGLPLFLVTNDLFTPVGDYTSAPAVTHHGLPPDDDPYDGRTWRVHAASSGYARALLDGPVADLLVEAYDARTFVAWVDGRHLACLARSGEQFASRLATAIDGRIAAGALDAWPEGPDPSLLPDLTVVPGTSWRVGRVEPGLARWLSEMWMLKSFDVQFTGEVDGMDFVAVRHNGTPDRPVWDLSPGPTDGGVVLVPLARPVPDHVVYTSGPRLSRGNVETEWLDFDDAFSVRAGDARLGHEVTTPRLMEHLYDHRIRRVHVKDGWMFATLRHVQPDAVREVVRVLGVARNLLPGYELERRPGMAPRGLGPDSVPSWPPRPGTR